MKITIFFAFIVICIRIHAQVAPINNSPGALTNGFQSNQFWSRAGNNNSFGNNNIFGTLWNSPIYMQTNGGNRIQVNHKLAGQSLQNYPGSLTSALPGAGLTRIGISRDGNAPVTQPLSLMHLGYNSPIIIYKNT